MSECVELYEYSDTEYYEAINDSVEYPCAFLGGVTTEEELQFFRSKDADESTSIKLYTSVEGIPLEIGRLELTLNSLLALRSIYDYSLVIKRAKDDEVTVNLNNPEELIKFIKL